MPRIETPKSSSIKEVEWMDKELIVVFKNGSSYLYHNVPQQIFEGFRTAPSVGKYFAKAVKEKFNSDKIL